MSLRQKNDYIMNITLTLRVRDVEDEYAALNYIDDFITGLHEFISSSDEEDDHYRIDKIAPNYQSFYETEASED